MANCLGIEAKVKKEKRLRANWYLDSWITKHLANLPQKTFRMNMLPKNRRRTVFRLSDKDVKRLISGVRDSDEAPNSNP
jgi:hypothetical protein